MSLHSESNPETSVGSYMLALLCLCTLAAGCSSGPAGSYSSKIDIDHPIQVLSTNNLTRELAYWYAKLRQYERMGPPVNADDGSYGSWVDMEGFYYTRFAGVLSELEKRHYDVVGLSRELRHLVNEEGLTTDKDLLAWFSRYGIAAPQGVPGIAPQ